MEKDQGGESVNFYCTKGERVRGVEGNIKVNGFIMCACKVEISVCETPIDRGLIYNVSRPF